MPHPARALALAIAALLLFGSAAPAEAAKKKANRPAAAQTRSAAKPKAKPRARPAAAPTRQPLVRQQSKAAQLNRIYDEYWDASMRLNPLQATFQGDARHNDQLPNILSAAYRQQSHDFTVEWLGKVEKIGTDGLTGQDLLSYEIFVRDARMSLAAEKYPSWMLPVSQYYNLGSIMAILGSGSGAQPFNTVADYDSWSKRSLGIAPLFDQAVANMRDGMKAGVVQPRDLMEKVLPQLDAVIKPTAEESIFWAPVRNMPEDFPEADKARITAEYKRMIEYRIMPAYRALRGFIATEYLPATRTSDGLGALPNGQAWYTQNIVQSTAATLDAKQIHAVAEQRVASLQAQITATLKDNKIRGSQQKVLRNMRTDRSFQYANSEALLTRYKQLQAQVGSRLPALLGTLPKAPLEVRAVEPERAASASAVAYQPPLPDGMRPGILYVNTANLPTRRRWSAPMQFLHEGIPGHHVQLGLQQELDKLPRFRRLGGDIAFIEGWGLYAESLGEQLGVYQDPYERIGYLQAALTRAARMAADTGVHAQGWSKRQAVDYLVKTADMPTEDATAEVERFMALPGQTLPNGLGELKMVELRERAKAALGPRFDLRRFHEEILRDGSMPLDILDAKMTRWIAAETAGTPAPAATP
ncbi:DUF885 family protein [Stenotrophomonas rhizophila]|uniref:DUF885 domain-containing protein n=1 Tax=Stenotrophomonas rhizophila TaxID=216778 RepID=UPI002A6A7D9B|nr:DUF885 family protein [Stenotrophomonas rhizophila]MDY0954337.1 DUF885 family protein [Stenotrophomonas rhizophila]